ncbi:MAG: Peptidase family [Phycisphaerales bacterium]|nr:Peptidase family [Phycisphaerales bacterium]
MAGPGANVVLLLISAFLYWNVGPRYPGDIALAIQRLTFANLGMLILNLLPIWPLDGGRMLQAIAARCLGVIRGWLLTCAIGLTLSLGASAWLAFKDPTILAASISPLIFFLVPNVQWTVGMLRAERERGINRAARCPWCGTHPLNGATGLCMQCGEACNLLTDTRDCWNCGVTEGEITRGYCGGTADVRRWSDDAAAAAATG